MLYTKKSFSVPASAGTAAECARVGHTQPDGRGKCYRCAERVGPDPRTEGARPSIHRSARLDGYAKT